MSFVQFSSSADVVASLVRIPQFFIPECPEAGNTQVCILDIQLTQTWKMSQNVNSLLLSSTSGGFQPDGRAGSCGGLPLGPRCRGGSCSHVPESVWGGDVLWLCGAGRQRLSGPDLGGQTDSSAGGLIAGGRPQILQTGFKKENPSFV